MRRNLSSLVGGLILGVVYVCAGKLGLSLASLNTHATPIWPPTGLALAALLLWGNRLWPSILVGAFIVNFTTPDGAIISSSAIAIGNTLEALLGAILARRFARGIAAFDLAHDIFRFVIFAAIPSTLVSATVGVSALIMTRQTQWEHFGGVWFTWWLGNLVSDLVLAPFLLIWVKHVRYEQRQWRESPVEAAMLASVVLGLAALIFGRWQVWSGAPYILTYLGAPLLLWAAFRFQQRGAVTASLIMSVIAIWGTCKGYGPFSAGNPNENFLMLQAFMGVNTLTMLALASVVAERRQLLAREHAARLEAEHASRAKDEFLAVLSHELRTPLTPVLLTASLLETDSEVPQKLRDDMHMIRRNVEMEARLIDDLLDVTRIARGKLKLDLEPADVHLVVRRAIDICCRDNQKRLDVQLAASNSNVIADSARMQQVFWNLLNNAMKFTPAGGTIQVRSRNSENGSTLIVDIQDDGIGIEPATMSRLFTAFEQGQSPQMRKNGGLGLGLAISRALMSAHAGTLTVRSDGSGHGSTFTVEIPTAQPPANSSTTKIPSLTTAGPNQAWRILLVEDHPGTLLAMKRLLTDRSHDVTDATTVAEALEVMKDRSFDLLISDLGLPDGLGHDIMRALLAKQRCKGIAISGFGMASDIQLSREAGFAEHLIKPVDLDTLDSVIARVMNSQAVGA